LVQLAGRGDALVGLEGEVRRQLDGHEAVLAPALLVDGAEDVERGRDVGHDHRPVRLLDTEALLGQRPELLVVVGGALDRLLEDRGVRREAPDAVGRHLLELAGGDVAPLDVVEPRTLAELLTELLQLGHAVLTSSRAGGRPRRCARPRCPRPPAAGPASPTWACRAPPDGRRAVARRRRPAPTGRLRRCPLRSNGPRP